MQNLLKLFIFLLLFSQVQSFGQVTKYFIQDSTSTAKKSSSSTYWYFHQLPLLEEGQLTAYKVYLDSGPTTTLKFAIFEGDTTTPDVSNYVDNTLATVSLPQSGLIRIPVTNGATLQANKVYYIGYSGEIDYYAPRSSYSGPYYVLYKTSVDYSSFPPQSVSGEALTGARAATAIGVEILTGTTSLVAPTNLTVSDNGTNLELTWNDSNTNEDGFKIYRSSDGTNFDSLDTSTNTNYSDNVGYNQRYYYKVTAYKGSEESDPSSIVSDSTDSQPTGGVTKDFIQDSLSQAKKSCSEGQWYFQQLPPLEDGQLTAYKAYFETTYTTTVKFALFEGDTTTQYVTNYVENTLATLSLPQSGNITIPVSSGAILQANKVYYIGFTGENYFEGPRTSSTGSFYALFQTTNASYSSFPSQSIPDESLYGKRAGTYIGVEILTGTASLVAPTNLTVSDNDADLELTWNDSNTNEDGFKIYRSSDGTNFDSLDTSTNTNYSDNVGYNQRYYYKVTAYKGSEESDPSSIVSDSTGSQPSSTGDYYVSYSSGSDSNPGTSPDSAWQNLSKIEEQLNNFTAGTTILLKRGDTWNETLNLSNFNKGTELNPVVLGAYGNETDPKPLITQKDILPDFTDPGRWKLDANIWTYSFSPVLSSGVWVKRLWIDDQEYMQAHEDPVDHPSVADSLAFNAKHRWKAIWDNSIDKYTHVEIWVPNVTDTPYVFYNKIEIAGTVTEVININNTTNVLLENLHIEGGSRRNVYIENSSKNITIEDCEMYNGGEDIINIRGSNTEKIVIRNNILDTKLDKIFDAPIRYEIEDQSLVDLQYGVDYCEIYGNIIKGGGISHVRVVGKNLRGPSIGNKIYNNEIWSANGWARAFSIEYDDSIHDYTSYVENTEFFNNHIRSMTVHSQFTGKNTKIYFNIWDSTVAYQSYYVLGHYRDAGDEDWGIGEDDFALRSQGDKGQYPENLKIFNNTFFISGRPAILAGGFNTKIVNNLFINPCQIHSYNYPPNEHRQAIRISYDTELDKGKLFANNYYFNQLPSEDNTVIQYGSLNGKTDPEEFLKSWQELESFVVGTSDTAYGGIQGEGSPLIDPVNDNFNLNDTSSALGAGDGIVAAWLPNNFKDRYGNTINQTSPNIGAIDNDNSLGKKSILEKESNLPKEYSLLGNYPNPFNPSTKIKYAMPNTSKVSLVIFDMLGRSIRTFEINSQSAGFNEILWDGTNNNGNKVSSGIYIYRIKAVSLDGNGKVFEKSAKLMLLK